MIQVIYFSGTGNTAYVADQIKDYHEKRGMEVLIQAMELATVSEDVNMLYLGFPVYACDMPGHMMDFINQLPENKKIKVKLFMTYGLFAGKAMERVALRLKAKGYQVINGIGFQMPGSDGLAFLKKDGKTAEKMLAKQTIDSDRLIHWIESDQSLDYRTGFDLAGKIFAGAMKVAERHMKARYRADERCIQCGLCVKICPVNNIHLSETSVSFGSDCILCMRCIHQCPKEAIQIGNKTVDKLRYKGPNKSYKPPVINT